MANTLPRVIEPRDAFQFEIKPEHIAAASPKDSRYCVIAEALFGLERPNGEWLFDAVIFPTVVALTWKNPNSGIITERYRTTYQMRNALDRYDRTKVWGLEPGIYYFAPVPKSKTREVQKKRARDRRAAGDENMDRKYPKAKRRQMPMNPRSLNLAFEHAQRDTEVAAHNSNMFNQLASAITGNN